MRKMAMIAVLGTLLILQGCGERAALTGATGGGASSHASASSGPAASTEVFKETDAVPRLKATVGSETVEALKGSYCWNDSELGFGVCADAAYPPTIGDMKYKPRARTGDEIALTWSGDPPDDVLIAVAFPGQERPQEAIEPQGASVRVAAGEGDQMYLVTATWPQGTVPYAFGVSAQGDEEAEALRKLAWEAIQESGQTAAVSGWKQAEVAEFEAANVPLLILENQFKDVDSLNGHKLLSVTFRTEADALLGPIVAVFDRESREVVGWLPRE